MSIRKGLDRGVLLTLSGAAILSSYTFTAAQRYGGTRLALWAKLTADAGAALTKFTLTLQAREDTADANAWRAVQSRNQDTDGGLVTKREHEIAVAAGTTVYALVTCDQVFGAVEYRLGIKADAGGVTGDGATLAVTTGA